MSSAGYAESNSSAVGFVVDAANVVTYADGALAARLPALRGGFAARQLVAVLPALGAAFEATVGTDAALRHSLVTPTASFVGGHFSLSATLPALKASFDATIYEPSDLTAALPVLTGSFVAATGRAVLSPVLPVLSGAFTALLGTSAALSAALPLPTLAAALNVVDWGALRAVLVAPSFSATQNNDLLRAALPAFGASFVEAPDAPAAVVGSVAVTLPVLCVALVGTVGLIGDLRGSLKLTATFTGASVASTLAAKLPRLTLAAVAGCGGVGFMAARLPKIISRYSGRAQRTA